ncbi:MAG TPA: M23 family metallopeptidase [Chitinophagales bacterium]|nr:M23 family metallopeptidase [Chitinophagales bacterium]
MFSNISYSNGHRDIGFIKPMQLPFNLAGSFAEPRKDHFHSGIDIKTNGKEGEPVFAIGDGYISRIRVSPYGYGKAIYITHNNGYTSVYGHLSAFYNEIGEYITQQHYAKQKSELDLYFDATKLPIKQGDTIAFSGNTGGSTAPHLHFEIRDSKTEHALNPLDFYPNEFYIDSISPQLNAIKITQQNGQLQETYNLIKHANYWTTNMPIYCCSQAPLALSLEGFDKQDTSSSKNGIIKMELFKDDSLHFGYHIQSVNFDDTRMCNAFIDYHEMMNNNGYFYNCYQMPNNTLPIYVAGMNGLLQIEKHKTSHVLINCYDYNDNKTTIHLTLIGDTTNNTTACANTMNTIENKTFSSFNISFPDKAFYKKEDIIQVQKNASKKCLSDTFMIAGKYSIIPLQQAAKIRFNSAIKKNRSKIIIVRQDFFGKENALKTKSDKHNFYADTKELGSFYLKYDTTKPIIEIIHLAWQNANQNIKIKIVDALSGIDSYNGYIDNNWVNFYYDAKNDEITYQLDEHCTKGEHLLKITVTDKVGNKQTLVQKFNY